MADLPRDELGRGEVRMTHPPDLEFIHAVPVVVLGIVTVTFTVWLAACAVRYLLADKQVRPALRKSWRIRRTWARTARRVGLVQSEQTSQPWWSTRPAPAAPVMRALLPSVTVRAERWGVRVDAATFGRLGLAEFVAAGPHLADAWRVPIVRVAQLRPGVIRIRALLHDPLIEPTQWTDTEVVGDPAVWFAGVDADGRPVTIRSAGVSGVVVAGLAGYGKTSFLNHRFCQLAANPAVQFVLIDGKGGPDYDDLFARAWLSAKDDPQTVRDHLERVHALMIARQHTIRAVLGVKNMWHVGPTAGWPLTVVVLDLCRPSNYADTVSRQCRVARGWRAPGRGELGCCRHSYRSSRNARMLSGGR